MIYMYNYNSIHIYTKFDVFHQIQSVLSSTKTVLILVCIRVPYPPGWNGNYRNLEPLGHQNTHAVFGGYVWGFAFPELLDILLKQLLL